MSAQVAAELFKLRSSGALARVVGVSLAVALAVSVLAASNGIDSAKRATPAAGASYEVRTTERTSADDRADQVREALTRWTAIALVALVAGIFSVAGEFQTGTASATFLAEPRRDRVLLAKALAGLAVVVPVAILAAALDVGVVAASVDGPLSVSTGTMLGMSAGGVLAVALALLAGLGLGALLRRPSAAIVSTLVVLLVVEPALVPRLEGVATYFPTAAVAAAVQSSPATGFATGDLAAPGVGALVAVAYATLALVAGAVALRRVDVG